MFAATNYATSKPPLGVQLNKSHYLTSGLVAAWAFNEGGGFKIQDQPLGLYPVTPSATTTWKMGLHGPAISTTAASASAAFNANLNPSILSFEIWFNTNSLAATQDAHATLSANKGYQLVILTTGGLIWQLGTGTTTVNCSSATGLITTNKWFHLVCTYDGTNARIYLNGNLVAGPTAVAYSPNISSGFFIGSSTASLSLFKGNIEKVTLWNRLLYQQDARYLYTNPYGMYTHASLSRLNQISVAPPSGVQQMLTLLGVGS